LTAAKTRFSFAAMDDAKSPAGKWERAAALADLERKRRLVARVGTKQIALFATANGVLACNNRCPHEGYPLSEGTLDGACVLTCNWHNWKFDLHDGANLLGGDRLRTYPVELRDGEIWVEVSDPPIEERRREIRASLRDAFEDNEYDRMAREVARYAAGGGDPVELVAAAIGWSYDRLEFGWTHAYAGAADWLAIHDEPVRTAEQRLTCVLEVIGHIADTVLREPVYPYADRSLPYDEASFLDAIERQDEAGTIALLNGALASGLGFADLECAISTAALAHYNDFGHSLIYTRACGRLIARLGQGVERPLLQALLRGIVYATREDLIPEFRHYTAALAAFGSGTGAGFRGLAEANVNRALDLVASAGGEAPETLYQRLLEANAQRLFQFDLAFDMRTDRPVAENASWLDVTHAVTFGSAARHQCAKFPELWPKALLQLACFAGRNVGFVDRRQKLSGWSVPDAERFFAGAIDRLFDHGVEDYIVAIHLVKTVMAARDELRAGAAGDAAPMLLAAVNRFYHTPLKQKHVRRTVRQALDFVGREG
jgi:nitrite reductase/ring-hydroxylating ferredoxin subunit